MRAHDAFFFSASGFIAGAIAGGLGLPPFGALIALILAVLAMLFFKTRSVIILAVSILFTAGNVYYTVDDYRYHAARNALANASSFEGSIVDDPRRGTDYQTAKVRLTMPPAAIFLRLDPYPELFYGDIVHISGDIVLPPSDSYGDFMAKEHVHGTAFYPEIEIAGNNASFLFKTLFGVRHYIKDTVGRLFTEREAAFLSGVLLGDRDLFTPEFLKKLSVSGTMHLTALSGLHMSILVFLALAVFSVFRNNKRLRFIAVFSIIALFVAMTGFKVSAVRASLMAFLVGLAGESGRVYSPRNAIIFSAFVITMWNPKSPVLDLGFQLSFAAVLSIIYFAPVLKLIPFFHTSGFLAWRDVLVITMAAQIGVLPITIAHFANFSLTALPANVAILVVMPPLMALGLLTVAASVLSMPLASLLSIPTAFLADYAIQIVETFSSVRIMFNPELGVTGAVLYYAVLIWICWRYSSHLPLSPVKTKDNKPTLQRHEIS